MKKTLIAYLFVIAVFVIAVFVLAGCGHESPSSPMLKKLVDTSGTSRSSITDLTAVAEGFIDKNFDQDELARSLHSEGFKVEKLLEKGKTEVSVVGTYAVKGYFGSSTEKIVIFVRFKNQKVFAVDCFSTITSL